MEECPVLASGDFNLTQTERYDGLFRSAVQLDEALAGRTTQLQAAFESAAAVWGLAPGEAPVTTDDVEQLFAALVAAVPSEVLDHLAMDVEPVACSLDLEAAFAAGSSCLAEAGCEPPSGPSPVMCSGRCDGVCDGTCVGLAAQVPSPASCGGICQGDCILDEPAFCAGNCVGTCSSQGSVEGDHDGFCVEMCTGICEMSAGAECPGTCEGSCLATTPGNECRDTCEGACGGDCRGVLGYACDVWDCGISATAAGAVTASCAEYELSFAYPTRGDDPDLDARMDAFADAAGQVLGLGRELQMVMGSSDTDSVVEPFPAFERSLALILEAGADSAAIVAPGRRHCVISGTLEALEYLAARRQATQPYMQVTDAFAQSFYSLRPY
jgi:hypothetical protein